VYTNLNSDGGVGGTHVVKQIVIRLADPRLEVVASNVVPIDAILVELVEDCQAVFLASILLGLAVVWLRTFQAENFTTRLNK
jgi:hypothetical protein